MFDELFSNLAPILEVTIKTKEGLFGLMIVALSIVGTILFRKANEWIRFIIFLFLFVGVGLYGYAIIDDKNFTPPDREIEKQTEKANPESKTPVVSKHYEGWIYLGTYRDEKWIKPRFHNPKGMPQGEISVSQERPLMTMLPERKSFFSTEYDYGDKLVDIPPNAKVTVLKTEYIGRSRVYAKVVYIAKDA
ncbi:hypothetical protein [Vibrio spartinae]|uniref:Uncharacterized protein n=1 Tax=Vibrio spartinae TaxID=1918945 RepID=A0A1N6M7R7_9VIBR|nr:hypothetical protein [Vibrio spartinae]SIO95397.1 hypothetical protein VSP9026_03140 [Vibrio spartinae]